MNFGDNSGSNGSLGIVNLQKGQRLSLAKVAPSMKNVMIGLGWDANAFDGYDFDLDASCFMLGDNGKVYSAKHFIFYNNLVSPCGSVKHQGDNLTGDGDGDDEQILVSLDKVPAHITKIVVTVTIFDSENRGKQHFGMIDNCFARLVDNDTGEEKIRYDLSEDYQLRTAMSFIELYRDNNEWKIKAVGEGSNSGLEGFVRAYGLSV